MGTSYYAFAVLGCEVTGKLYRDVEVLAPCIHGSRLTAMSKFCPQCGQAQTEMERHAIEHFDEDDGILNGLKVVYGGFYGAPRDDLRAFAGIVIETNTDGSYATRMMCPSDDGAFQRLMGMSAVTVQTALEEIGMWDPDSFGLWAVLAAR